MQKHIHPVRVYFEDTDAAGFVYHANYIKFAERARAEMLRDLNLLHSEMQQRDRQAFVVRQCTLDYLSPGYLDDSTCSANYCNRIATYDGYNAAGYYETG